MTGTEIRKRPSAPAAEQAAKRIKRARIAKPLSMNNMPIRLNVLFCEADFHGFDAKSYMKNGYAVFRKPVLTDCEISEALAAAHRVRATSKASDNEGEFVFLRHQAGADKLRLFSLLNAYVPLLHQIFGGIRLPGSDMAPYAHHNQIQLAIKKPGFEGYDKIDRMHTKGALVGHVDQPAARQNPPGRKACNYSALLGIVLNGDTHRRDDAGNLFVAPGSHKMLAEAFRKVHGVIPWHPDITEKYLSAKRPPCMEAVRAKPGHAYLMHHQTIHAVAPNRSEQERVVVYFRITADNRPNGKLLAYHEAMRDTLLETPLMKDLAARQNRKGI